MHYAVIAASAVTMAFGFVRAADAEPDARAKALAHKQRGDVLARDGQLERAAIEFRQALALDPTLAVAHNELGNVHFSQGKFEAAVASFRTALQAKADYPLARYNLAYALRKAGRFLEAAAEYRRFLAARPADADGTYGLAETLKSLGDRPGAIAAFRRYLELEKRPSEAGWVVRAKGEIAALEKGEGPVAAAPPVAAKPAAPLPPAVPPKLVPARRVDAMSAATEPPAAPPPSPAPPAAATTKLPASGAPKPAKVGPARAASRPGAAPIPTDVPKGAAVAAPEPAAARPAEAQAPTVRVSLAAPPGKPANGADALLRQGEIAFRLRDYAPALRHLEGAARAAPDRAEIHYKLGAARAAAGDLRGALSSWEAALRLDPSNEAARDLALRTRERLGLLRLAEGASDPLALGRRRLAAGRAAQALAAVDRALRAGTPSLGALLGRAEALVALGRYGEARRALLEAAALRPGSALPYFHLADCHRRLGEPTRATYYFRLYLTLTDPGAPGEGPRVREARRWLAGHRAAVRAP